jgi:SIR2-like protein
MTVFVFGAGVSVPGKFPLSKQLYCDFKNYVLSQAKIHPFHAGLIDQWTRFEGQNIFDANFDIETNLTQLDIHARKDRDLVYFRGYLEDAFTEYFNEKHRQVLSQPAATGYLRTFVNRYLRPNDTIITFNYDCLIERALHEAGLWSISDGYGFQRSLKSPKGEVIEPASRVKVLKLHGSLGWVSGVIPEEEVFFIQSEAVGFAGYSDCEDAAFRRGSSRRALVMPSYVKLLDFPPLPAIWRLAAEALRKAVHVVFIGYSMPSADSAALMLFLSNMSPTAQSLYCWFSDRRRAEEITTTFEAAGIPLRNRKCSMEDPPVTFF